MAKIVRFEDLIAWQKARWMTQRIYSETKGGPFKSDLALRDQLRKASVSVMSNLAEGFERRSRKEFLQFLSIAKASCAEVRSDLYVASDAGLLAETPFRELLAQAEEVARIIGGLGLSLSRANPTR